MLFNTSTNTTYLHQAIKCILFFVSISSGTFELNSPRRHSEQISIGIWQLHWINNKAKMEMQLETEQILDIFFRRIEYQYIMWSIKISIGWRIWLSQRDIFCTKQNEDTLFHQFNSFYPKMEGVLHKMKNFNVFLFFRYKFWHNVYWLLLFGLLLVFNRAPNEIH